MDRAAGFAGKPYHLQNTTAAVQPLDTSHWLYKAGYEQGRQDGYDDAVRQIKAATHAIKRGKSK